jgi:multidrug efflux pump subunit AcrB
MFHSAPTPDRHKTGLIDWFLHNHVAANILMLLFILGGMLSLTNMRTETFPSIDPKLITVSVPYPGATPYEVAEGVTSRVEEALSGINGVKRITATASEGHGTISVKLTDFVNPDDVYSDVETAVNSLSDFPPEDAERAVITKARTTPNVMSLAVHGHVNEKTLKYWVEDIEENVRQIPGVALTTVRGVRDYEVSIEVPEASLEYYDLSLEDVRAAVKEYSVDVPAGQMETASEDILLRVQEKRYVEQDFKSIALKTLPDGTVLTLGDVARIVDGFADTNLISRFNGEPSGFIDVKRGDSDDTLTVAALIKGYLETVKLPEGMHLSLQSDETIALKDRISLMARNGILGFMLVFLILLLFLDLKLAFWTSAAIPISFFGGLMIIHFMGFSVNMITLFALIVVLGVVVDDGIIMGESIFDSQEKRPDDPESTIIGVRRVLAPVTVGVSTTIAAFAPLMLSTGTLGQIIAVIPAVVIPILFVSLLEAYFILPAHLSGGGTWSLGIVANIRNGFNRVLSWFVDHILTSVAHKVLVYRYATLSGFVAIAIITMAMVQGGVIRFVFFPPVEGDSITITVTMPQGTPFKLTEYATLEVEKAALFVRDVLDEKRPENESVYKNVSVTIGATSAKTSGPGAGLGASTSNNVGQVIVQLVPSDFRALSASQIEGKIRDELGHLTGLESLDFQSSLIGGEPDIEVWLSHRDEDILSEAAERLKAHMETIDGTLNVQDSFHVGKTEYVFKLSDAGRAVGLTPSQLGSELRAAYFGLEAQRIQRGRSEVVVYVRYPETARTDHRSLMDMKITLPDGRKVPLSDVAVIQKQTGYSQIETYNTKRIVSVTADADINKTTPTNIMTSLQTDVLPMLMGTYQGLQFSFEGESREQSEDMASLGRNMVVALLMIFVLLGAQLRSYAQPFVIMMAIPFGVVGAILGHYVLGQDLSFISLFGIVALTGVVVNDSVVLVDYLNTHARSGVDPLESSIRAVQRRFRPILLTTLSTCLGLLPVLLEKSMQAQFLIPMVTSLAMGILFATVVILFLVPCLILVTNDIQNLVRRTK